MVSSPVGKPLHATRIAMPGLLTPALCFGGGALIGIGIFVALNWEPICDRIGQAVDEQRLYWEAIQEVRAQRREAAQRGDEKPHSESEGRAEPEDQAEKASGLFLASDAGRASESESEPEQAVSRRKRFTEPQRRRGSRSEQFSPELFAVYAFGPASSSDEEPDEESDKSDSNEFSSYDKLDSSDLSSY